MLELIAAAEGHHVVNELFMPPVMFGALALAVFLVLLVITYAFHRTAHSHPENSEVSPFVPYVHPGHAMRD